MSRARVLLRSAGKTYSACAKITASRARSPLETERLIGFGLAVDWVRRAAALKPLAWDGAPMNRSPRNILVSQMVRFNFQWTAMNAIFGRSAILDLVASAGAPRKSELDKFRILFDAASIPRTEIAKATSALHDILSEPTKRGPSILSLVHDRYVTVQPGKVAKAIAQAATTGAMTDVDLPMMIYVARNWFVHGVMGDSAFDGVPRFKSFIDTINESLGSIHLHTSQALLAAL